MHYLEKLRTEHTRGGSCSLCSKRVPVLERHHEKYRPECCLHVCHACHHKLHFTPWALPDSHKRKLLRARLKPGAPISDKMVREYVAPGRRPAQLEARERARSSQKI